VRSEIVDGELAKRPNFDELLGDFGRYLSIEAEEGTETPEQVGRTNPLWSIRTAEAIRIIREERHKVSRELRKRRDEEFRAWLDSIKTGQG
jgi:hypothetical protein